MRIAFITHLFPPAVGGMQRWNLEMALAYKEAGHSVDVFHFRVGREEFKEKSIGYKPVYIWPGSLSSECPPLSYNFRILLSILFNFIKLVPSLCRYDLWQINICEPALLRILAVAVSILAGKKVIVSTGCTIYNHPYKPGISKFIKLYAASLLLKIPKLILVDGSDLFNELVENGVNKSRIRVCYASVDIKQFSPDKKTEDLDNIIKCDYRENNRPLILYCSRFSEENAPFDFLRTVEQVKNAQAVMCGDGKLRKDIENYISSHRLDVILAGSISYEDLPFIITSSTLCLYTFSDKIGGISQVIPLSMACGGVVLTTDVGDNRQLIRDDYNGFIVPPGNIEAMKKSVAELLENDMKREKIGLNARNTIVSGWSREKRRTEYKALLAEFDKQGT